MIDGTTEGMAQALLDDEAARVQPEVLGADQLVGTQVPEYDGEFEYPLTTFIPGATTSNRRQIPDAAAVWYFGNNLEEAMTVQQFKAIKVDFVDKVPAGYNVVYVRKTPQGIANPTDFQKLIRTHTQGFRQGSKASITLTRLLPVMSLGKEGQWIPRIAEIGLLAWEALEDAVDRDIEDDNPVGPYAIWREGNRDFKVRRIKDVDAKETAELRDRLSEESEEIAPYVMKRSAATEEYFKEQIDLYRAGEAIVGSGGSGGADEADDFVNLARRLSTAQMREVLQDADLTPPRTKIEMLDMIVDNEEKVRDDVEALAG